MDAFEFLRKCLIRIGENKNVTTSSALGKYVKKKDMRCVDKINVRQRYIYKQNILIQKREFVS